MHFSLGQVPISRSPPFFSCGCSKPFGTPCFGVLSLRIEKWALECSCVPKGVGATFCSKTGPFFSCGCSKPSGVPACPRRPKPHSAAKQSRSCKNKFTVRHYSLTVSPSPKACRHEARSVRSRRQSGNNSSCRCRVLQGKYAQNAAHQKSRAQSFGRSSSFTVCLQGLRDDFRNICLIGDEIRSNCTKLCLEAPLIANKAAALRWV